MGVQLDKEWKEIISLPAKEIVHHLYGQLIFLKTILDEPKAYEESLLLSSSPQPKTPKQQQEILTKPFKPNPEQFHSPDQSTSQPLLRQVERPLDYNEGLPSSASGSQASSEDETHALHVDESSPLFVRSARIISAPRGMQDTPITATFSRLAVSGADQHTSALVESSDQESEYDDSGSQSSRGSSLSSDLQDKMESETDDVVRNFLRIVQTALLEADETLRIHV